MMPTPLVPKPTIAHAWHDVDWKMVFREYTRMRSRIFAAAKRGDRRNLGRLQKLFVSSKCNILYSVRRVTMFSSGKKTKGVVTYLNPDSRMALVTEIQQMKIND